MKRDMCCICAVYVLYMRMSNVTCTWMSHVTLPYTRHTLIHESCHTCTRMSHVTHIHANLSFYRARHTLYVRMSHVTRAWMSHVTILYTSQVTHVHAHANLSFNRASHTLYVRMPKIHRSHIPGYFLQRGFEPPLEGGHIQKKKCLQQKKTVEINRCTILGIWYFQYRTLQGSTIGCTTTMTFSEVDSSRELTLVTNSL